MINEKEIFKNLFKQYQWDESSYARCGIIDIWELIKNKIPDNEKKEVITKLFAIIEYYM